MNTLQQHQQAAKWFGTSTTTTPTELHKFKSTLEAKRAELEGALRSRDGIVIEKTPDALDELQLANERDLAIRNLARDSNLSRQIRQALARIAEGSYGVCLQCDEDISAKRIEAVPWASFCIRCQERMDCDQMNGLDHGSLCASKYRVQ